MQICVYFLPLFIFSTILGRKCLRLVLGENDVLAVLYFVETCGLYVSKRGVCGYGYIHGYPWIYTWIFTENLWIWIWMGNFISTASLKIYRS